MTKKTYFLSDAHLGMFPENNSKMREKLLVEWMTEVEKDAEAIYFLGDIFDFWYEYKKVVPKGFTRFLGKLASLTDKGIKVYFFTGNHDVWCFDYLEKECGVEIVKKTLTKEIGGKCFYLAHGDGLGPGDKAYGILKWAFHNKFLQWLFSRLHPNFAMTMGQAWSKKSRLTKGHLARFFGEAEWLVLYSREILKSTHFDYFIYGHRHLAVDLFLTDSTKFVVLGDWIVHFTYAEFDGTSLELKHFKKNSGKSEIIRAI